MDNNVIGISYDGIIILDSHGEILEMNQSAKDILGIEEDYIGRKYAEIIMDNAQDKNDEFHQVVLDLIADKMVKKNSIEYCKTDGSKAFLNVTATKMGNDKDSSRIYIICKDITKEEEERRLRQDSVWALIITILFSCFWNFASQIWLNFGQSISSGVVSKAMVVFAGIAALCIAKTTKLSWKDMGLSIKGKKKEIIIDAVVTLGFAVAMILLKVAILAVNPEFEFYTDGSFFMWGKYSLIGHGTYLLSVIGQEIISRGILHESLTRILPNDKHEVKSILISSVIFGSIHIHLGLVYMFSAMFLLMIFGFIYRKQRSIWGLCIPHFFLAQLMGILGFVVY